MYVEIFFSFFNTSQKLLASLVTYIQNRSLQPFSQNYGPSSHTLLMLYMSGRTPNDRFSERMFMANSIYSHGVFFSTKKIWILFKKMQFRPIKRWYVLF